ncbi:DUF2066 domain-containing protein [Vibrio sp.]|uniref:DUF2066 domain-containing protein n=1 Tax=Vibrio sp. TaxID=678 RepID=UPI003D0B2F97
MRKLALLVVGLIALPVQALTNVDLFRSEVILDQSQANAESDARITGMKQVIVRATGDQNAPANDVVRKALRQNSQYLSQLSYGQFAGQETLKMNFNGAQIRALLSQAQLPFWPEKRANLLVWMVEESNMDRNIVWETSDSELLNDLRAQASLRGLPVTIPVGDFDDITGLTVSDVWGGFMSPVAQASERYPADAILVVKGQGQQLQWALYDQAPANLTRSTQAPLAGSSRGSDAMSDMVDQISDYYAKKSAVLVASESSESVKVQFNQINNAFDFFLLEGEMKQLSSVAGLDILKIQGNTVTFNVELLAPEQDFVGEVGRIRGVEQLQSIETSEWLLEEMGEPQQPVQIDRAFNNDASTIQPILAEPVLAESELESVQGSVQQAVETAPLPTETVLAFNWLTRPRAAISDRSGELPDSSDDELE